MEFKAFAKINWDLHVLGKRSDGFHELDTVMVNVSLFDSLIVEPDSASVTLTCSDPTLATDDTNLVVRAAKALKAASGYCGGVKMHLVKRIPMGGGMGGGSSDAACALRALNELWDLHWEVSRLQPLAAGLGSDVAFFLYGGWCRCLGRGEIVEPLKSASTWPDVPILLVLPKLHVPTPQVYKRCSFPAWDGKSGMRGLTDIEIAISSSLNTIGGGRQRLPLRNDLTAAAVQVESKLVALQRVLQQREPGRWLMSGSGAVHFVVGSSADEGASLCDALKAETGLEVRVLAATTAAKCSYK